jgi:hypothetical protein
LDEGILAFHWLLGNGKDLLSSAEREAGQACPKCRKSKLSPSSAGVN